MRILTWIFLFPVYFPPFLCRLLMLMIFFQKLRKLWKQFKQQKFLQKSRRNYQKKAHRTIKIKNMMLWLLNLMAQSKAWSIKIRTSSRIPLPLRSRPLMESLNSKNHRTPSISAPPTRSPPKSQLKSRNPVKMVAISQKRNLMASSSRDPGGDRIWHWSHYRWDRSENRQRRYQMSPENRRALRRDVEAKEEKLDSKTEVVR